MRLITNRKLKSIKIKLRVYPLDILIVRDTDSCTLTSEGRGQQAVATVTAAIARNDFLFDQKEICDTNTHMLSTMSETSDMCASLGQQNNETAR